MDYILNQETDNLDFDRYREYLNSIQDKLPAHIYSFAADAEHFDLRSRKSLHDGWLETVTISEPARGDRKEIRQIEIRLCVLGAYHDRHIHLHYTGVERYEFNTPARHGEARYAHTAHGDLLTHEIRLGNNGLIVHEILFERGTTLLIECGDIRHSQEMINP